MQNNQQKHGRLNTKARSFLRTSLVSLLNAAVFQDHHLRTKGWGWEFAHEVAKHIKILNAVQAWKILMNHVIELVPAFDDENGKSCKLADLVNVDELADKIITFYESLPHDYTIYYVVPTQGKPDLPDITLGPGIEIFNITKDHPLTKLSGYSKNHPTTLAALMSPSALSGNNIFGVGSIVLSISVSGFADNSIDDEPIEEGLSTLKCLLYLGKLLHVFDDRNVNSPWGPVSSEIYLVDESIDKKELTPIAITDELSKHLPSLALVPKVKDQNDSRIKNLMIIGQFLSAPSNDVNRAPIATAAEWAFDSETTANQTVAFIQMCIGLEAVLGDEKTEEALSKTLADRCAYLLGKNPQSRKLIRSRFKKMYDHRSKLVHGRKVKLDEQADEFFFYGRKYLAGILRKELLSFEPAKSEIGIDK